MPYFGGNQKPILTLAITMTIIRVSIATVACIPHNIANGIHVVAPKLRSRYTVHAIAVSMLSVGLKMDHNEREALRWIAEHTPRLLSFFIEFGWGPLGELLKGIGAAPYIDGAIAHTLKNIAPEEKKD